ncbi:MAG: hypothetical protein FGM15_08965 [Chthoniobacterales bacterium]|nr:hypothetical protein [Chthoniobacterales bacterium]
MSTESHDSSLEVLLTSTPRVLDTLAVALREGPLRQSVTRGLVENVVGAEVSRIYPPLAAAFSAGCPTGVLADMCEAFARVLKSKALQRDSTDLVLSGPDVPGVHVVDTATVARSLFREARSDVIVCSYVIFLDEEFFAELAQRHDSDLTLRVRLIVDVTHGRHDETEPMALAANRFRQRFIEMCWVGERVPELYHDPRGFSEKPETRGVMHAKVIIIDEAAALVTSANFTAAAQRRNIEAGVLFRDRHQVKRLRTYFEGLIARREVLVIS